MQTNFRATAATIFSRVSAPPPPLIIAPRACDFVGAVDVDRDVADVVELLDVDAVRLQPLGRLDRARDRALDPVLDLRELVDEEFAVEPEPTPSHASSTT